MTPADLQARFDQISEAPDAVPRLRRFILDLAVRGKLVSQDPKDESASDLLKRIQAEKKRLIEADEIREQDKPPQIAPEDTPHAIPSCWKWVPLGEAVIKHLGGGTPSKDNSTYWGGDIYWASVKDVGKGKYLNETIDKITAAGLADSSSNLIPPGYLIVVTRMGLGKVSINRVPVAINQDLRALLLSSLTSIDYCYFFLKTYAFEGTGLTVKGIKTRELLSMAFPMPPLSEQHRIVAKVDELMALCDRLEVAQKDREDQRDRLVASSLQRLNEPSDETEAFREHARFHINHLPEVTTRPEHVQKLRQTILNLAVRGKLVPQEQKDEPAAALLQRIDNERAQIAEEDKRADPDTQELLAEEHCWEIPPNWSWRGMADLALFIDYRGKTPTKVESGIRLITAKNVRPRHINLEPEEFVSKETYEAWMTRGLPRMGDVLFTTEAPMGNAAVIHLREQFALAQRTICFRLFGGFDPTFMTLQILSPPFQAILDHTATGLTAKGIKSAKLQRLPFAVPPLAEQHRIVSKVDELMAVCNRLEVSLQTTQVDSGRLLEAVLHEALEIAT